MKLTKSQITDSIEAKKSFWVESESERCMASNIAKTLRIKYTTGKDDRGGFYVCHLNRVFKPRTK